MFGMACGLYSHNYEELITLRNFEELEQAADAVLMFDPSYCLYENLVEILKCCKHVFISDTSHLSRRELKQLSAIAREAGVIIQVRNPMRYLQYLMVENRCLISYFC